MAGDVPAPAYKRGDNNLPTGSVGGLNDAAAEFQPQTPQDQFIFGPTSRPEEPVTHGLPFGPGAGPIIRSPESDTDKRKALAYELLNSPNSGTETKRLAKRMLAGQ